MTLDERLAALLAPLGAESKRMFGGTCFMVNGNMAIGTFKDGILMRVGKEGHATALKLPGARAFEMQGRTMQGYVLVDAKAVASDTTLKGWVERALAFVNTLPAKAAKAPKKKR
jgi:TfoX/Sxy family transcriptional regulator of competence genes